jgi:Reverse transcriptase (RNA-dependent DNA polymerase)
MDADTVVSRPNAMGSRMEIMIILMYRCRREKAWIHELPCQRVP